MRRLLLLLFACIGHSDVQEPSGVVWLNNPSCGGILIEPDIVLSLKTCFGPGTTVVWPYRTAIVDDVRHSESDLVMLILDRALPHPAQLIQTSEISYLRQGLPVRFANLEQSMSNWIHAIDGSKFSVFYGIEPAFPGSPVLANLADRGSRVVGMMIDEKHAMRLDPYFNFIGNGIKFVRNKRQNVPPIVLPAETLNVPPNVVLQTTQTLPSSPRPTEVRTPASVKPPESLGCSCSQVRR